MDIRVRHYLPTPTAKDVNIDRLIKQFREKATREFLRKGKTAAFAQHMEWLAWAIKARQFY